MVGWKPSAPCGMALSDDPPMVPDTASCTGGVVSGACSGISFPQFWQNRNPVGVGALHVGHGLRSADIGDAAGLATGPDDAAGFTTATAFGELPDPVGGNPPAACRVLPPTDRSTFGGSSLAPQLKQNEEP